MVSLPTCTFLFVFVLNGLVFDTVVGRHHFPPPYRSAHAHKSPLDLPEDVDYLQNWDEVDVLPRGVGPISGDDPNTWARKGSKRPSGMHILPWNGESGSNGRTSFKGPYKNPADGSKFDFKIPDSADVGADGRGFKVPFVGFELPFDLPFGNLFGGGGDDHQKGRSVKPVKKPIKDNKKQISESPEASWTCSGHVQCYCEDRRVPSVSVSKNPPHKELPIEGTGGPPKEQPAKKNVVKGRSSAKVEFSSGEISGENVAKGQEQGGLIEEKPIANGIGLSEVLEANDYVRSLITILQEPIMKRACEKVTCPTDGMILARAIKYRVQHVAGSNFFVRMEIEKKLVDAKIFEQTWTGTLQLLDIQGPKEESDPIVYF